MRSFNSFEFIGCRFKINKDCITGLSEMKLSKNIYCPDIANVAIYNGTFSDKEVVIRFNVIKDNNKAQMLSSLKIASLMSDNDIGPNIIKRVICSGLHKLSDKESWEPVKISIIIMERLKMGLDDYYEKFEKNWDDVKHLIIPLVEKMHSLGVEHNDLHKWNVMVNADENGDIDKVKIIDFDDAKLYNSPVISDKDMNALTN